MSPLNKQDTPTMAQLADPFFCSPQLPIFFSPCLDVRPVTPSRRHPRDLHARQIDISNSLGRRGIVTSQNDG